MKPVTMYEAEDGARFHSEAKCAEYERLIEKIADAKKLLPDIKLEDAKSFQLDPEAVLRYQRTLVALFIEANPRMNDHHVQWALHADRPAGNTLIGRYMDDCGPRPIYSAWFRIMCIDQTFRQWSQPYYAALADRGKA